MLNKCDLCSITCKAKLLAFGRALSLLNDAYLDMSDYFIYGKDDVDET